MAGCLKIQRPSNTCWNQTTGARGGYNQLQRRPIRLQRAVVRLSYHWRSWALAQNSSSYRIRWTQLKEHLLWSQHQQPATQHLYPAPLNWDNSRDPTGRGSCWMTWSRERRCFWMRTGCGSKVRRAWHTTSGASRRSCPRPTCWLNR